MVLKEIKSKKCLFVSIVGKPNAGKSTLMNTIIGQKVSIVSSKCQTTRRSIRGITEIGDTQIVFIDTPGFFYPKSSLEKIIEKNFKNSYTDADVLLLLIDGNEKNFTREIRLLKKIQKDLEVDLVINKVDIANKKNILEIAKKFSEFAIIKNIFMISALKNDGIQDIIKHLVDISRPSEWFFEPETHTDMPITFRLAEITREKLFKYLEKELPYSIYVETENFHETEKKAKIFQTVVVIKSSQKGIILGKTGNMIKKIKLEAIKDMQQILGKKIELKIFVKVREKWTEKKEHLHNAGIID